MTRAVTLRPLQVADAARVARTVRTAFTANPPLDPPASALRESAAGVRAVLAAGGGVAAMAGTSIAACLLWQEVDDGLYLSRVSVLPCHRRQGIGIRLIVAAEAEADRRGLPRIWLSTRLALAENRAFFAQAGFRETALHAHPGYDHPTFVDMVKDLA